MIKYLIFSLLLISQTSFGQTNYNTILAPKKDSLKIDLKLQKEKLDTISHLMLGASCLSTMIIYSLNPKSGYILILPASLCIGSISTKIYSNSLK